MLASAFVALLVAASPAGAKSAKPSKEAAAQQAAALAEEAARLAKQAADLTQDGAPPAAPAAEAVPEPPKVDADVMGFLSLTQSTSSRDGGVKLPWEGPGGSQLKLSWDALDKRNEQLSMGDMMARSLVEAVRAFYDSNGGLDPQVMRGKLVNLVGAPIEDARTSYLDAINWEERRLFFIQKAVDQANQAGVVIPGVDAALVARRLEAIRSGAVKKALAGQIDGYRDLAQGLVAYLDGDNFLALQKVRNATAVLQDLAVAHAFLGSLYFLFDQRDAAVAAWRRANELDPSNDAVRQALMEYGRKQPKQAQKKR